MMNSISEYTERQLRTILIVKDALGSSNSIPTLSINSRGTTRLTPAPAVVPPATPPLAPPAPAQALSPPPLPTAFPEGATFAAKSTRGGMPRPSHHPAGG